MHQGQDHLSAADEDDSQDDEGLAEDSLLEIPSGPSKDQECKNAATLMTKLVASLKKLGVSVRLDPSDFLPSVRKLSQPTQVQANLRQQRL